jgi:hypothetical protein
MKKSLSKAFIRALLPLFCLGIMACSKKKSDDSPAQSLNKGKLTNNKEWYNQGSSIVHIFKSNGVYTNTGTWKWVNNSDTMEIVTVSGGYKTYWKMYWNNDHEMSCQRVGTPSAELYKDQGW